jgi:hypothetical protein
MAHLREQGGTPPRFGEITPFRARERQKIRVRADES